MQARPKIKIELALSDKALELAGWLMVILMWGLSLYNYSALPATIPTHFNGTGQIDDHGSKVNIFLLPIAGTLLYAFMTFLNKFPHIFNYPVEISADNAEAQYRRGTRLIRYLKLVCVLTFLFIEYTMVQSAIGKSDGLGPLFFPLTMVFTFIPVLFFVVYSMRKK